MGENSPTQNANDIDKDNGDTIADESHTPQHSHETEEDDDATFIEDCDCSTHIDSIIDTTMALSDQPPPPFCNPSGICDIVGRSEAYRFRFAFWAGSMRMTDFFDKRWNGKPVRYLAEKWRFTKDKSEVHVTWSSMWVRKVPIEYEWIIPRFNLLLQEDERLWWSSATNMCYIDGHSPQRVFHLCLQAACEECKRRIKLAALRKNAATYLEGLPQNIITRVLAAAHSDNELSRYFRQAKTVFKPRFLSPVS